LLLARPESSPVGAIHDHDHQKVMYMRYFRSARLVTVVALVGFCLALTGGAAVLTAGPAGATVSNPGPIHVAFAGSFTFTFAGLPVVIDGISATADGTVDSAGNISLPQGSILFAPLMPNLPIVGSVPATINATANWTGTIDPNSGALTLSAPQTTHLDLSGPLPGNTDCPLGPLNLNLTTSGGAPAVPYDSSTGQAGIVDSTFTIPMIPNLASCPASGTINMAVPLPLTGGNVANFTATFTPILKPLCGNPDHKGYWMVASDGSVSTFGGAPGCGSTSGMHLNAPVVGMASTQPPGPGYWLVAGDGGVFSFNLPFFGSLGGHHLNKPIVGMAPTPTGNGYWLVAADGGVFTFGDASFFGSTGNLRLNKPVVGMTATLDGKGYVLVAADGGVFTFGDASFHGSAANIRLNAPAVGMAATQDGNGYWLVAADGGVFTFGDAGFHGSTANLHLNKPVVGMSPSPDGQGYSLGASDGGVFTFGSAVFQGSLGAQKLARPIVGIAHD
jgi:hypothetical protein